MNDTTLYIRHLPKSFSIEDKINFLQQYGATNVRCMPNYGKMRYTAFASFPSKELAECALHRLHQLELLGQRLIVQFAQPQQTQHFPHETDLNVNKDLGNKVEKVENEEDKIKNQIEEFTKQLNAIAPHLGINYPPSPLLRYKYPPPTPSIIANINNALASVPKFYTQVLHLMNKMNMPAPFGPVTAAPPLQADPPILSSNNKLTILAPDTYTQEEMDVMSSEESEYQSEEEERKHELITTKRQIKKIKKQIKRPRLQKLTPAAPTQNQPCESEKIRAEPSQVFETVELESKKILFNIKQAEEIITENSTVEEETGVEMGGFGTLEPQKVPLEKKNEEPEDDEEMWQGVKFISRAELERNKVSNQEIKSLSAFKNYAPGEATYRLYLKNLPNHIDYKDLLSIYGRYIDRKNETERNMFDIRLMKEGRMKGQAFITLANETQAKKALQDTHGYLLKGKPIVVQFARSARPKEDKSKKKPET